MLRTERAKLRTFWMRSGAEMAPSTRSIRFFSSCMSACLWSWEDKERVNYQRDKQLLWKLIRSVNPISSIHVNAEMQRNNHSDGSLWPNIHEFKLQDEPGSTKDKPTLAWGEYVNVASVFLLPDRTPRLVTKPRLTCLDGRFMFLNGYEQEVASLFGAALLRISQRKLTTFFFPSLNGPKLTFTTSRTGATINQHFHVFTLYHITDKFGFNFWG